MQIPYVPEATVAPILKKLRQVVGENSRQGVANSGISASEADSVLRWLASNIVERVEMYYNREDKSWSEFTRDKCVIASKAAKPFVARLPNALVSNFNMANFDGVEHSGIHITLPVLENAGSVRWKHYVVDTTFAQFFDETHKDAMISKRLSATADGGTLASTLLTHGYAELTETAAEHYTKAFLSLPPTTPKQKQMLMQSHRSYLQLLSLPAMSQSGYSAGVLC